MKRDFADFWNLLWEAALGVCAAFALLNIFAPHQDLPWKPLDLSRPIGQATAAKVADFELARTAAPEETTAVTEACMQVLREAGIQVERAEDRDDGGFCVVRGAIRITGGAVTLLPGNPVLHCPLAVRYVIWERQVLQPAAQQTFGSRVARLNDVGTYSCRRIYGRSEGAWSEHSTANAVDIAGFRLADGTRISVLRDWTGSDEEAAFLRDVRDGACDLFSTVLSPDYNQAHRDHFHFDQAQRGSFGWRGCR